MRQPSSRRSKTTNKRSPSQATPCTERQWTFVEPTLSPMITREQAEALNAAELARKQRPPRRLRATQQCTMGYGYYPDSHQRVPALRLRGRWLEQLGFAIGCKLRITVRDSELVITVVGEE
ncbi:SymE family type I addiction module toxin [Xanthomonas oryzae]|uniref:SymE family type I addiction module toxin n=1 Tax=Xanthomonas oryzae TaxID=347 RepID=UPI000A483F01|nr:SymE family type I addiction module toxin [Xanthomonas oryzae]MDI9071124.1 SymE family type I addiction module toxin [Xanthomonas oryzae pv. oryzae]MDI9079268.1 SymE family type I addiction module toxin [Xanthomonas oryzae pv. oryzae]MDI9102020.1 SymE family type I addiction module toxin [Xanthomonas oryzae pv. oryzae]MDI9910747.1 SymE family type I addiction module toxin [Xanthomonas oryzae pv. oryzae]WDM98209.1 type I toxin-antitoxin system SymE family toxin [Xanthomonas oryzae]